MAEMFQLDFFRNALAAGVLISVVCGVIGSLVVVNRIVFLAGGITHAAYGGIGLAVFMGWPFLWSSLGFSLGAAAVMAAVTLKARHRSDVVVGVIWAVGMAFGVILIDLTPGYQADWMSYLFGSILTVPPPDLWRMGFLVFLVLAVVVYFYRDLLSMSYDEEFARLRRVPVTFLYFLQTGMIAVTVVMMIRVVGLIMVIALLTIPPYIAEKFTASLKGMMFWASVLSACFTVAGLIFSYLFDLSPGGTIILVAALGFLITVIGGFLKDRFFSFEGKNLPRGEG